MLPLLPLVLVAAAASIAQAAPPDFEVIPTDDDLVRETQDRARELLEHYRRDARFAYIGTIRAVGRVRTGAVPHDEAQIVVEDALRGRRRAVVGVRVPIAEDAPSAPPPSTPDAPQVVASYPPPAIVGHRVLVFVDKHGWVLDGDALYVVAGPLAWRSTEEGRFMRPDQDRDWWDELTPGPEWVRLELGDVHRAFSLWHRRGAR